MGDGWFALPCMGEANGARGRALLSTLRNYIECTILNEKIQKKNVVRGPSSFSIDDLDQTEYLINGAFVLTPKTPSNGDAPC